MTKGLIADIQRASVHDGPGLRTTVFFKGCPMKCRWCHNPECISFFPQILLYPERCIGCGRCEEGCYSGAQVICGKEYTPEELLSEILLDKDYYDSEGGVTFSGGEPLAQRDFLREIISLCKREGIHCAVETSLILYDEEIFRGLDLVMADFKIWDGELHRTYTGMPNEGIKANFRRLNSLGIPIIARTPIIPGISQGIERISAFLQGLENVKQYELLPYHPLGNGKREALGLSAEEFAVPEREYMEELKRYAYIR